MKRLPVHFVLLALATLVGCAGEDASETLTLPPAVRGEGTIAGTISLSGTPPKMQQLDASICHVEEPIGEETVIVGTDGGLKNVVVYLKGVPASDGSGEPPALLDQVNCQYVPHVVAVQVNQPLCIRSSDATLHNVHYSPDHNASQNFGMTAAGQEKTVSFGRPEFVRVKCDVHPWMSGYVAVLESPFFAVTGDDGSYRIKDIPPGTYTLVAWHELFGEREQKITVEDRKPVQVDLTFSAPGATQAT